MNQETEFTESAQLLADAQTIVDAMHKNADNVAQLLAILIAQRIRQENQGKALQ